MPTKKTISSIILVTFSIILVLALTFSNLDLTAVRAAGIRYAKPGGTGDCSSWLNACTLQNALTGAASGNEIWAAAGVHKPTTGTDRTATFLLKNGVAVFGGFGGTETIRKQRNPSTHVTILSGDLYGDDAGFTNNLENVYHVVTGATSATLDGFTITAGNANGTYPDPNSCGGGIYNLSSSPSLANLIIDTNATTNVGGGMYNLNSSSPTLTNVTFSGNKANSLGGGMANSLNSSPTLSNVIFRGNTATNGGGMFNEHSSSPELTKVTFNGNNASSVGGGMLNEDNSSPTLTNITLSGNTATYAGGIENYNSSSPILTNVTFSGNTAISFVGGMINAFDSNPQIRNTIFWSNTDNLYGVQIDSSANSIPVVSDSVVQGGCPMASTCTNIISEDPILGPLGINGGFTQTIPLLAGSSAIDAGNNATCASTDQRGYGRPVDGDGDGSVICDIGAYEAGAVPLPPPSAFVYLPLLLNNRPQITPTATSTPTRTLTPTVTPTATPTIPAPPGPQNGIWKFSAGVPNMDRNMSFFRVQSNSITTFRVYLYPATNPCSMVFDHSQTTLISGGSFYFSDYGGDFVVSGSFPTSTSGMGNIKIIVHSGSWPPGCTLGYYEYNGPWQASYWGP